MSPLVEQSPSEKPGQKAALEFHYDTSDPISLAELADSFRAIDALYARTTSYGDRLAVVEIRSGSIFAVFSPYLPLLGHSLEVMNAINGVIDFSKYLKGGIDWVSGRTGDTNADQKPEVATEIAEILRPLSGKDGAKFGVTSFRYRSRTKERTVEVEATYDSSEIDRAYANVGRLKDVSNLAVNEVEEDPQPTLLRRVKMALHQANAGPAKATGQTGDRGIIRDVSEKKLPVYFAAGVNDLKRKMVDGTRNPLKGSYIVDVIVTREAGEPKKYTVIEVYSSARTKKQKALPLMKAAQLRKGGP